MHSQSTAGVEEENAFQNVRNCIRILIFSTKSNSAHSAVKDSVVMCKSSIDDERLHAIQWTNQKLPIAILVLLWYSIS